MHLNTHLDLDVVAHETEDHVSVLVELTAPQLPTNITRSPATLVVVLDRSGSMAGDRIEAAKTALLALVDRLDPRDRFGLVAFDDHVQVVVPAGPLVDKLAVRQAIAAIDDGGSTDLSAGYFRGLQEARRVAGRDGATLLLVSDGHANAGVCDPTQLGDVARKAHADGITTTTLGMGLGFDERLLSAIAAGGAGNEHFAENADDAVTLVAGEVDGLLSLAAQAGSLLVRMSPHVRGVRVVNELPSVVVPEGVLVELGSFCSGESRKLVLTFDVPGIPALGLAEIATLEFTFVALPALEQHTVTVPLHVNVVPGDQAAGRIPDPVVRTELAFQQAQRAKREASTALSAGDSKSARRSLRAARSALQDACAAAPAAMAAELQDELAVLTELQQQAASGDLAHAAKLSSADASYKSRTRGRTRPWA
ncbi:Ca-activated chloride channel family protein [Friedmanniella luteola]|uniref:Ca-activated chloride channel family protein n=1 Tax=Friedmanniella luteola TaxID=546871 RepID=A0A1H1ZLL8_9ACTN|nr:Ca-activated chloride channel family protein [Friedmanniella luteola]